MATMRALNSLPPGTFPNVAGLPVGLKVNLVLKKLSSTGATTDPLVAQAVADYALAQGASHVFIVEAGQCTDGATAGPPPFQYCGYAALFAPYTNVTLVDLDTDSFSAVPVPNHYVFPHLFLPNTLLTPGIVMISVAKVKTHIWSLISCSTKNWFGLFVPPLYNGTWIARADPHSLGLAQSIVDMHLTIPCQFAVIDGIIGMEGNGPWNGPPINSNVVLAGNNMIATDYVAMQIMGINKPVTHLVLAANKGLGPTAAQSGATALFGDLPIESQNFTAPQLVWPYASYPLTSAQAFSPSSGQKLQVAVAPLQDCFARVEIVTESDPVLMQPVAPGAVTVVKTLLPLTYLNAKQQSVTTWDGSLDAGGTAAPGSYYARESYILANLSVRPPVPLYDSTQPQNFNFGSTPVQVI